MYGEARGEGLAGLIAVAHVIQNRVKAPRWWGNDIETVCLKKEQFSCWNDGDPNRAKLLAASEQDLTKARMAVALVFSENDPDPTNGANHYHAYGVKPVWCKGIAVSALIGRHLFYKL